MDVTEIEWEVMDWIQLAQDRGPSQAPVDTVMDLRVPTKAGKFMTN
jgi:hypothetical protein